MATQSQALLESLPGTHIKPWVPTSSLLLVLNSACSGSYQNLLTFPSDNPLF